jgi:hypothetical protein
MDDSNIVNEVLQELVTMIEAKMAGDLKQPGAEPAMPEPAAAEIPMEGEADPFEAEEPAGESDEEKTKRMLMEKFGGK